MLKIFTSIIILTILSCSSHPKTDNVSKQIDSTLSLHPKPLIIEGEEDSWGADLRLSFTEASTTDKETTYLVNSIYNGKNIGFTMTVPKHGMTKLLFKSDGQNSDNFIHLLQNLYKQKTDTTSKFIDSLSVDCLELADLNQNGGKEVVLAAERKLFFQGANENDYAELYLNINKSEHWIELIEKDEEYRPILIKLLTKNKSSGTQIKPQR